MSWVYSIVFLITVFVTGLNYLTAQNLSEAGKKGEVMALSGNMAVYQSYVVAYAQSNPTATGSIPDASLGLPAWFNKDSRLLNYVSGGKGYTYVSNAPAELSYQLLQDTNNSIFVGVVTAGNVTNPMSGSSTIPIPAAIPNGVTIYAN